MYRGSTVIPYLEAFYNYEGIAGLEAPVRWDSQDEEALFDTTNDGSSGIPSATQSLASVSHERSLDMIASRKSRVQSQENGRERERGRGRERHTDRVSERKGRERERACDIYTRNNANLFKHALNNVHVHHLSLSVLFPTSRSVDELGATGIGPAPSPKPPKKRRGSKRRISEQCIHQ